MTLPEHAICSVLLAQFAMQPRFGWRGTALTLAAGIAPDLDVAAKLFGDDHFWRLHHALGHSLASLIAIALTAALVGRYGLGLRPFRLVLTWCAIAVATHLLTDAFYFWGVQLFWPWSRREFRLDAWESRERLLEYLDLIFLAIWLSGAVALWLRPALGRRIAAVTLSLAAGYVLIRAVTPAPTGWFAFVAGNWMYGFEQGTPVLDWW